MKTDVKEEVQLDLFSHLQQGAYDACAKLADYCNSERIHSEELHAKFYDAVADVERVTIEELASSVGAFTFSEGTLRISEGPVAHLLSTVTEAIEKLVSSGEATPAANEIPRLLEKIFVEYVFHEVRHRTQGLEKYEDVKALKRIAGPSAMSEYDTLADRDAALAAAAVYAADTSRAAFLAAFRDALFFSTDFFFQVFPVPGDRPDKVGRAMAILLMAARVAQRDFHATLVEDSDFPLDAAIHVDFSLESQSVAVHQSEPQRKFLGSADARDGVDQLYSEICRGDMKNALRTSISIANKLKLIT